MRSSSFSNWIQNIYDNNEILIFQFEAGIIYSDCFHIDDVEIFNECIKIYSDDRMIKIDMKSCNIKYNECENEYGIRWDNGIELLLSSSY